jgi:eukaryotic-like serine/threonine-protein kinase
MFLSQACGKDEDLRAKVEQMLAHDSPENGNILDGPVSDLFSQTTVTDFTPGSQLDHYRIERFLGRGGMGVVYNAVDTRLERRVAIKICSKRFSHRFRNEALAISALNHPHICTLHDVGQNYLVMEYVEGKPLSPPLPAKQAFKYAVQICAALDEAHRKGITHRDLKPGNILVTKNGVKLLDFGLARFDRDSANPDPSETEGLMGTPEFIAPEQWEGKAGDARSDIYAFGCVLYRMLTGSTVSASRRELPDPALERVVSKCLEPDPEERWQSIRDIRTALEILESPHSAAGRFVAKRDC